MNRKVVALTKEQLEECKSLDGWLENVPKSEIDAMLEWLGDSGYLNKEGKLFLKRYWHYTWHLKEGVQNG